MYRLCVCLFLFSSLSSCHEHVCDEVAVESEVRQCQASGHSRVNIVEAGAGAQVRMKLMHETIVIFFCSIGIRISTLEDETLFQSVLCENLSVTMDCMDIWLSCYGPAHVERMKTETVEDGLSEFDSLPAYLTAGIDLRKCAAVEERGL